MAHLTRPAEISGVSAGLFPETAADNRAYFKPYSQRTMQRILSSCAATTRKSLQGLDYIAADGAKGFDDIQMVVDKLCIAGLEKQTGNDLKQSLKEGKKYLKTDYKVCSLLIEV